ncbi:MAG: MucR family transcriptional regulator [Desulfovibrio sp.]
MDQKETLEAALEIVKAQAGTRPMTAEEIVAMVRAVMASVMAVAMGEGQPQSDLAGAGPAIDPQKAIKESSITCLECGKSFKVITRKHLATHGLTAEEYRAKYGYKKTQALACKSLARERRKKMKDMKLWERRTKSQAAQ